MSQYEVEEENGKLVTRGVSAHGSTPDKGVNAILKMVKYLEGAGVIDGKIREYLFEDKMGLKQLKDETGNLTMSPDIISLDGDEIKVWHSGLTRYSQDPDSFVVNSSQGGGFKDTWVLSR